MAPTLSVEPALSWADPTDNVEDHTVRMDRLAAANLEILEAAADFESARALRRRSWRGIEAIDGVLEALEEYHLAGRPRKVAMFPAWRAMLEQDGGLSIPDDILKVRHTVRLYDALADWQENLLNDAVPGRAELAAVQVD